MIFSYSRSTLLPILDSPAGLRTRHEVSPAEAVVAPAMAASLELNPIILVPFAAKVAGAPTRKKAKHKNHTAIDKLPFSLMILPLF
jgi:riboflavin transporter FmnP